LCYVGQTAQYSGGYLFMKWFFATVTILMLAGCSGVEWFPENTTSSSTVPTITSVSPDNGAAGTLVTITGTNFSATPAGNVVKFNGTTAVVATSSTATQIFTAVPTGASTGPITVTVGSTIATSPKNFIVTVLSGGAIQGNALSLASNVTTLAGTAGIIGAADGTGAAARFTGPYGITTDGTNLYVADVGNNTIRKIVIATGAVTTIAGTAGPTGGSTDATGAAARFNSPIGVTTDGTNLYVTDSGNNTIRKVVIATGVVTTLAGSAGNAGSTDGFFSAARFDSPIGITTDGTNLYVADAVNNTIRKIVIATASVSTIAGTPGPAGSTDGTGSAASFTNPSGITTDGTNLYVADAGNNTIRKIVIATGAVTTLAGTAGNAGSADGTGSAAGFNSPAGITTDGTNLYVADSVNNTIRKIVIASAVVTTIAGTAGTTGGSTDATGAAASFNSPADITTDGTSLYVADTGNNTIRAIK
jgi:sugar lactone lactonase YvrE